MRRVEFLTVISLTACSSLTPKDTPVPLELVPKGYTQAECWVEEAQDQGQRLQSIEYWTPLPLVIHCSHQHSRGQPGTTAQIALQRQIEAELKDPGHSRIPPHDLHLAPCRTRSESTGGTRPLSPLYGMPGSAGRRAQKPRARHGESRESCVRHRTRGGRLLMRCPAPGTRTENPAAGTCGSRRQADVLPSPEQRERAG